MVLTVSSPSLPYTFIGTIMSFLETPYRGSDSEKFATVLHDVQVQRPTVISITVRYKAI